MVCAKNIQLKPEPSDNGQRTVTMIHRKVNDGRFMPPSSLRWEFLPTGAITCSDAPVSDELRRLKDRIYTVLLHDR